MLSIEIQRIVETDPQTLFAAWTHEDVLKKWWGPRHWTASSLELEPKVGGVFSSCVRSPQGHEARATGTFQTVEPARELVFTHAWQEGESKTIRVGFSPSGAKTNMSVSITGFKDQNSRDCEVEGWHECFERLVSLYSGLQQEQMDRQAILELVQAWSRAAEAKDATAIVEHYVEEATLFDACPPYLTSGRDKIKEVWEHCFPCFPEKFRSEHKNLDVQVAGDLAVVHGVHHFLPEDKEHPMGKSWMRITVAYKRVDGVWKAFHDHVSQPFNPLTNEVWVIKDPSVFDMPDYAAFAGKGQ